jgi:aryl-alcohol dehydrogenase-like predicted oxidoreductase
MLDRIALGTVQIGLPYGRQRTKTLMSYDAAAAILEAAWRGGIRAFDTAEAYGDAASRLRRWLDESKSLDSAHVVTKVRGSDIRRTGQSLREAVNRFEGVASRTLLTHGSVDEEEWLYVFNQLSGLGVSVGQSVYSSSEVRAALACPGISRIQAPGNILDDSVLDARGEENVSLDIRSVFLQGLLLDAPDVAEKRVPGARGVVAAVAKAALDTGERADEILVASMLVRLQPGDRLVIGADDPGQLDAVFAASSVSAERAEAFRAAFGEHWPGSIDAQILDPRRWPSAIETTPSGSI